MKSLTSLACVLAMTGFALPSAAQEPAAGPIARTAAREATRLAAFESSVPGRPDAEAWDRVLALEPGTRVVALVRKSGDLRGTLVASDETSVTIAAGTDVRHAARADVFELRRERSFVARHPGPAGLLIGAAVGAAWVAQGFASSPNGYRCNLECGLIPMTFAMGSGMMGGIGSAIGASIGAATHSKREDLIYLAP